MSFTSVTSGWHRLSKFDGRVDRLGLIPLVDGHAIEVKNKLPRGKVGPRL
jgi:hypothetical protein